MSTNNRKENKKSSWIGLVLFLLFTQPFLVIPLAVFGGIIYLVVKSIGNQQKTPSAQKTSRKEKFDDCPQSIFCFHRDKGEHHVRRGREIDPWDRPDIDISKYQRNR